MNNKRQIKMFKNGEWVEYDGSDVSQIMIEETITLKQLKKYHPKEYKKIKDTLDITDNVL